MIIRVFEEGGTEREVTLEPPSVRIGRSRECQLFIPDPALSRQHAEFVVDGAGWQIVDHNSKNHTYLNGRLLEPESRYPLAPGDKITVGKTHILFDPGQMTVVPHADSATEERTIGSLRVVEAPENALTRILVEGARGIAAHRAPEDVLHDLLALAVRATSAERGVIARHGNGPLLVPVASFPRGASPPVISRRVRQRVLEHGEALSLEDLPNDLASQGTIMSAGIRSILCAPLGTEPPFRGVLYLDTLGGRADFNPQHLEAVTILAGMADVVLEAASTREERERRQRVEAQLQAAEEIQRALLPSACLETPDGIIAAGYHRACLTVGGDMFDFFHHGDAIGVMLADVAGKGFGAALMMANLHARWHGVRLMGIDPGQWLERLNDEVIATHPGNRFITMAFALVDAKNDEILFASAGHNPALLRHGNDVVQLDSTGPILGIIPGCRFDIVKAPFPHGSSLVLYSDGVTDQQNSKGEPFGIERLTRSILAAGNRPCQELLDRMREDLDNFAGETAQDDDTTITVLDRPA